VYAQRACTVKFPCDRGARATSPATLATVNFTGLQPFIARSRAEYEEKARFLALWTKASLQGHIYINFTDFTIAI
jgi:hypothetical protein